MSEAERWNQRYEAGDTPWDTGLPSCELQRVIEQEHVRPCRAIELGCGTGVNAVWLAQQGFDVTAIDLSPLALERARHRAESVGVKLRFLQGDVLDPPREMGGPYEFVFDRGCYHAVRRLDVGRYLQTLDEVAAPGSRALILAGNAREPHDPGPPVVSEDEIRAEIGRVMEIVWLREFYFDQAEGVPVRFLGWSCFARRPTFK